MCLRTYICTCWISMCTFLWGVCHAETPDAPTRIVVPSAPGGNLDFLARVLADQLSDAKRGHFFVENRAGAAGSIATAQVARAKPDGHTLLLVVTSHTSNVHLYPDLGYDPLKSFTPIAGLAESVFAIVVPAASPAKDMRDLIVAAQAAPGTLNYGSSGVGQGNHLGMALLLSELGLNMVHVPFNSAGAVTNAVMGHQIDVALQTLPGAFAGRDAGKMRILAVTGMQRIAQIPDVPTLTESTGLHLDLKAWQGLVGPAGMSSAKVEELANRIAEVMSRQDVVDQLSRIALTPNATNPETFRAFLASETQRWGSVIQQANIRLE